MTSSFIQAIEPQLKESLELPEFPYASFPLEEVASLLSKELNISPLKIEIASREWRTFDAFFLGFGSSPLSISLQATPLNGDCFWIMAYEDVEKMVSWLQDQKGRAMGLKNPDLIKGLYRYISLGALEALSKTDLFQDLSLKLTQDIKLPEKGYAIDIAISHGESQLWARLILSSSFKNAFMSFFSKENLSFADIAKQFPHLTVSLSVTNGDIELSQSELASLNEGDFVIVENAYFKPATEKGSLKVSLKDKPLFQVKAKEGEFKILDFLYAYEEKKVHA